MTRAVDRVRSWIDANGPGLQYGHGKRCALACGIHEDTARRILRLLNLNDYQQGPGSRGGRLA